MPLLPIFSFTFSLFILWNIGFDLLHKKDSLLESLEEEDLEDFEPTREEELFSLLPSAIINLGWMGYVKYTVPSALSSVLFDIAPLLFLAELLILILPQQKNEPTEFTNFISYALFFLQAYFSVVYLIHCTDFISEVLQNVL